MSFSASSPTPTMSSESAKSRNTASESPQLSNDTDLGLDPSDPLNLWLHNTSQGSDSSMDDSSGEGSPPDWSQLSALWPSAAESGINGKVEGMDFSMSIGNDMDFVNSMVIDPNTLHFGHEGIAVNELLPGQYFPFTFQPDGPSTLNINDLTPQRERKLSITSSGSSSGASFSPIISPVVPGQVLNQFQAQESQLNDPAAELARRVRESAGVTLAVPMDAHMQKVASNGTMSPQHSVISGSPMSSPAATFTSPSQSFMSMQAPSPSLYPSSSSATSSAPSTPPPTTPPPSVQMAVNTSAPMHPQLIQQPSMGVISRPKTSHTTIERRYRTNLNARITSLRMAVPALRVLEDKEGTGVGGGGKKGKNSTLGKAVQYGTKVKKEYEDGTDVVDVIDERGFVDGVKVARKCSKANVLGKAVEYIRVLKKREMRLKREQDGLKQLISGLVGGPALLREWEREWRAKFGGSEKDEVEGEEMDDGPSDDESGDDEDDEDGGRKRKKPKISPPPKKEVKERKPSTAPPPQPQVLPDGTVIMPEKRKRGRPRKIQPTVTPVVMANPGEHTLTFQTAPQPIQPQQQQPASTQYLLAVFALFSFFNSPFSSSSTPTHAPPNHSHTGTVLTHDTVPIQPVISGWTWHEIIQAFHLLVSALVFCSIVLPWLPVPSTKYFSFSYLSSLSTTYRQRARSRSDSQALRTRSVALREALSKRGSADEANELRNALGSEVGVLSSLQRLVGKGQKENFTYQQKGLEQSAWVRLGELCVLGGESSALNRALTWWHIRAHLSWFTASAADLSTLALVLYPVARFARQHAKAIWQAARARKGYSGVQEGVLIRPHERLVLETMEVDEAIKSLEESPASPLERTRYSPIGVLACTLVKRRMRDHLKKAFVKAILSSDSAYELEDDSVSVIDVAKSVTEEEEEERRVRVTIDAARSLGGKLAEMGEMLESIWTMGTCELDLSESEDDDVEESVESEILSLFSALVLYRRIFSSSIMGPCSGSSVSILLSPPPSPSRHDTKLHLSLRRALGSSVFESTEDAALEDARDRVVDMLIYDADIGPFVNTTATFPSFATSDSEARVVSVVSKPSQVKAKKNFLVAYHQADDLGSACMCRLSHSLRRATDLAEKQSVPQTPSKANERSPKIQQLPTPRSTPSRSLRSSPEVERPEDAVVATAGADKYAHLEKLTDRLRPGLDVVFCGINPAVMSAEVGFHFAHPTNKFWKTLHGSRFTPVLLRPQDGASLPDLFNLGLTDLVERPTVAAKEIKAEEKIASVPSLLNRIARHRPRFVCFVGLEISKIVRRRVTGIPQSRPLEPGLMGFKLLYPPEPEDALDAPEGAVTETFFWAMPSTSGSNCKDYNLEKLQECCSELRMKLCAIQEGNVGPDIQGLTEIGLPLPPLTDLVQRTKAELKIQYEVRRKATRSGSKSGHRRKATESG
ncbi:hypothetical protein VNI00_011481 [Paramarasmius palmivorus]|uniref:BHLH domain-containing protein n=1 Tax=Paramarasmius palmivorus TaxID=297713 RepID=A0AAW0CEH9_9AGAR